MLTLVHTLQIETVFVRKQKKIIEYTHPVDKKGPLFMWITSGDDILKKFQKLFCDLVLHNFFSFLSYLKCDKSIISYN
jgi:hypothetical protein